MLKTKLVFILLGMVCSAVLVDAQNLVKNPGFEEKLNLSDIYGQAGWGLYNPNNYDVVLERDDQIIHSGEFSGVLIVNSPDIHDVVLRQLIDIKGGETYSFFLWYQSSEAPMSLIFVFWDEKSPVGYKGFDNLSSKPNEWIQYTGTIRTPENTTRLALEIRPSSKGIYRLDDISLLLVPAAPAKSIEEGRKKRILILVSEYPTVPCLKTRELFEKNGYEFYLASDFNKITPNFLNKFDIIILGTPFPKVNVTTGKLEPEKEKALGMLWEYVKNGGSILITHAGDQDRGLGIDAQNEFLEPMDAKVLKEIVLDANPLNKYEPESTLVSYVFYHTSKILPSPVSEGVKGLNYVCYYYEPMNTTLQNPIKVGPDWTVVVQGEKTAYSKSYATGGGGMVGALQNSGTYSESPPLVAIREFGKGRVALWPINSGLIYLDGYHKLLDGGVIMNSEVKGKPSNGEALFYNLLTWLCEPSTKIARAEVNESDPIIRRTELVTDAAQKKYNWDTVKLDRPYKKSYKGLIGAISGLSSGTGTPEEFIEAAKNAGYDFIIFTEDLAKMDATKWEKLRTICKDNTTADFLACPGLKYLTEQGSECIIWGPTVVWPKDEWRSKKYPERLIWSGDWIENIATGLQYETFPPSAVIKDSTSPKPAWFLGHFKGFAVYTYEDGNLVDDSYETYLKLQENTDDLFPLAVHLVKNPAEVASAAKIGYQTYTQGNDVREVIRNHTGLWGYEVGWWTFISSGPLIDNFRGYNLKWADMAHLGVDADRLRLRIEVSSEKGLREVKLLDGTRLVAHWLPEGTKTFSKEIDRFHDRSHAFIVEVTDVDGNRAISSDRWTYVEDYFYGMCRDNWNTFVWGKCRESSRIKPIKGFENYIPQNNFFEVLPRIFAKNEETKFLPAFYQIIRWSGRFGSVVDNILYGGYDPGVKLAGWHIRHYPYEIHPIKDYSFTIRRYEFMTARDNPNIQLYEGEINFNTDIEIIEDKTALCPPSVAYPGIRLLATNYMNPRPSNIAISQNGKVSIMKIKGGLEGKLNKGDYFSLYPSAGGSLSVISLMDGMKYGLFYLDASETPYATVGIDLPSLKIKSGTKVKFKFITVVGPPIVEDQEPTTVKWVTSSLGLSGEPTYKVNPTIGNVLSSEFILKLKANNGSFRGTITEARLPLDLPILIEGLNERWDAGIWYPGKNKIAMVERKIDEYSEYHTSVVSKDVEDLLIRIPVMDGCSYCQIDTSYGNKDIFIGNFVVCDQKDIFIRVVEVKKGYARIEVNNPTDKPVKCTVKRAQGFTLIPEFSKTFTVKTGDSIQFEIR